MEPHPYRLEVATGPSVEPVTLEEAKAYMRVDVDVDDAEIERNVQAARQQAEKETRRTLINTTLRMTMGAFPQGRCSLVLPRPPLVEITSVVYADASGVDITMAEDAYVVERSMGLSRLHPRGGPWPSTELLNPLAVRVTYVAGYGATPEEVPAGLREAVLAMALSFYDHRGVSVVGTITSELAFGGRGLLDPYRVMDLAVI